MELEEIIIKGMKDKEKRSVNYQNEKNYYLIYTG